MVRFPAGRANGCIKVKLVGKRTNHAAIGARIKVVTAGEKPQAIHRHVSSGSSFGGNPLEQTIGLGKATRVARLEIHWPTHSGSARHRQRSGHRSHRVCGNLSPPELEAAAAAEVSARGRVKGNRARAALAPRQGIEEHDVSNLHRRCGRRPEREIMALILHLGSRDRWARGRRRDMRAGAAIRPRVFEPFVELGILRISPVWSCRGR